MHEEIKAILTAQDNRWMTAAEIAEAVNRHNLYRRKDGEPLSRYPMDRNQINARIAHHRYRDMFERAEGKIRLAL
ncbi:MAG: hypothetical protein OYH76_16210 [Defluviicoccus sp.]|nr:hypothetical protein [Defluviicoccus sp.]MDE0277440.1 hypothetical protein [Defluviicoccus sp.]